MDKATFEKLKYLLKFNLTMFVKLKNLPYSHRWSIEIVNRGKVFAIKLGAWLVFEEDAQRLAKEKRTHKRKLNNLNNLCSDSV